MVLRFPREAARHGIVALLLAALVWLVFAQAVGFEFVGYDDDRYVTQNPFVHLGVTAEAVAQAFTRAGPPLNTYWQPVAWLSLMLDAEIYGIDAAGFHRTNVLLHLLNALLLYAVLHALTASVSRSALVAALFAIHPLHVEPVAWVSERGELLSTGFGLLSIAAYAAWSKRRRARDFVLAAVLLGLALMSKATLVTLPCLFLLLDVWPLRRTAWPGGADSPGAAALPGIARLLREKLAFLAIAAAGVGVTLAVHATGYATRVPLWPRFANALVSYARYLGRTFWPHGLTPMYPHPYVPELGGEPWAAWQIVGAAALLASITAGVLWSRRGYLVVGWLWFVGTLVPMIGLVQQTPFAMADRYSYFPLIGLFVGLVWGAFDLTAVLARRWRGFPAVAASGAVCVLVACAATARVQASHWRDSLALYTHAVQVTPRNPEMLGNLGTELRARGDLDGAISAYRRALETYPGYAQQYFNLGNAFVARRDLAAAIANYRRAVELQPTYAHAHFNLASAHALRGDYAEAARHYQEAIRYGYDDAVAHRNLGHVLTRTGALAEAIRHYERALQLAPADDSARQGLASARKALETAEPRAAN